MAKSLPAGVAKANKPAEQCSPGQWILNAARVLEEGVHPNSAYATLTPRLERFSRRRKRVTLGASTAGALLCAYFYVSSAGSLSSLGWFAGFIVSCLLTLSLAYAEFPRLTIRVAKALDVVVYHTFPWASFLAIAGLIVLMILQRSPAQRLQVTIIAIGAALILRGFNSLVYGRTYGRRHFRLAFARHTQRAVVVLAIFAVSWTFLLAASQADPPGSTSQFALAGATIAAVSTSVGAGIRLAARQRKHATQLVSAIDDAGLQLRLGAANEKLLQSWLTLDRSLMSGADTGVPMFATDTESEHMRALLTACILRVTEQTEWDPSWKLLAQAIDQVATWDTELCRSSLLAYLAESRRYFQSFVDTTA
jgi:hypothetical protein